MVAYALWSRVGILSPEETEMKTEKKPTTPGEWKAKGKTVYVDDATNAKGWKSVANATSEGNAQLIARAVNALRRVR